MQVTGAEEILYSFLERIICYNTLNAKEKLLFKDALASC